MISFREAWGSLLENILSHSNFLTGKLLASVVMHPVLVNFQFLVSVSQFLGYGLP